MSLHYAPGPSFALVRPGLVVLVDASVSTGAVADLWAAVVAAHDPDQPGAAGLATLLDAVTGVLDPTWRALPSFAIAVVDGDAGGGSVQVAVRGTFVATVTTPEAAMHVSGANVMTWVDKKVDEVVRLELGSGATQGTSPVLTISDGIVQVEQLRWDVLADADVSEGADVTEGAAADGDERVSRAEGMDSTEVADDLEPVDGGETGPSEAGGQDVGAALDAALGGASGSSASVGSDHVLSPDQQAEVDFAQTLAGFPEEWDDELPEPNEELLEQKADLPEQDETDADFDDITVLVAEMAEIRALTPPAAPAEPALPAPTAVSSAPAWPSPGHLVGTVPPPPPPPPPAASVPPAPAASSPASQQVPSPADQRTPQQVEPFREVAPLGVEVLARSCFFGHPNPPARMACAQCGGGLSPTTQLVERPSLGRVDVSTGESVDLSVPVVVGRFPQAQTTGSPVAQRLVTVPSPSQDISRSHLEIRLDGWHVLLVDLDTVNGTTLLRPGQPPRRLRPLDPTLVADGDVVDLGDGITLRFHELV